MYCFTNFDIKTISESIKSREVSVVQLTKEYLARIRKINPIINGMISVDEEDAIQQANKADSEIAAGNYRGRLHGIPISLKDIIYTKDLRTTMGSKIFENYYSEEDAFVVTQLKNNGAIIVGKSNTEQFAYGTTGDQSYFGAVKNPHNLEKCSGGSSSGSAASVSAGLVLASIGTDTGGSNRIPASFCGVVSIKPTYGLLKNDGVYPVSQNLDHLGPITRNVYDNAIILENLVHENTGAFTKSIEESIKGLNIGIPYSLFEKNCHEDILASLQNKVNILKELGCTVFEIEIENQQKMSDAHDVIRAKEAFKNNEKLLNKYESEHFNQEIRTRLLGGKAITEQVYKDSLKIQKNSQSVFDKLFNEIDIMLLPTISYTVPNLYNRKVIINKQLEVDISQVATKLTRIMNLNGFPTLNLPAGLFSDSMPIGLQIVANKFNEKLIYRVANHLESNFSETYKSPFLKTE